MYHSQTVTTRRGPLSKVWLAAHFDKKLSKGQIFSTDITASVQSLLQNENHFNLKVSGQLMLGIVKIYAKKLKYLMNDCTESMWKMKLALRPGQVDIEILANNSNLIDDLRHFGNINTDFDFPIIDNIAFDSQYLLSTECFDPNSNDYAEDSYNSSFISGHTSLNRNSISFTDSNFIDDNDFIPNFNDTFSPLPNRRFSDIEFARNANDRASSVSVSHVQNISNTTPIQNKELDDLNASNIKSSDANAFSTLPGEDLFENNDFNDYYPQEFDSPQKVEEEKVEQKDVNNDQNGDLMVEETELDEENSPRKRQKVLEVAPVDISEKVVTSKRNQPLKIRRVVIDENVELSDAEYRKNISNPQRLLRRSANDKLAFQNSEKLFDNQFKNQRSLNSYINNDFQTLFSYTFNHHLYSTDLGLFSASVLGPNIVYPVSKMDDFKLANDLEFIRGSVNHTNEEETYRLSILDVQHTKDEEAKEEENVVNEEFQHFDDNQAFEDTGADYYDDNIDFDQPESPKPETAVDMSISARLDEIFLFSPTEKTEESSKSSQQETQSKKTEATYKLIKEEFEKIPATEPKKISFKSLCQTKDRRVAAQCFFELLQLKTKNSIQIKQNFSQEIIITPVE